MKTDTTQRDLFRLASELLDYNPGTGEFHRRKASGGQPAGSLAGCWAGGPGYLTISLRGKNYYAHRIAWLLMTGEWPSAVVDHINRNKRDNRWVNLRVIGRVENLHNVDQSPQGANEIRGVSRRRDTGKWYARIRAFGVDYRMGPFLDCELAILVRAEAHRKLHASAYTSRAEAERMERAA